MAFLLLLLLCYLGEDEGSRKTLLDQDSLDGISHPHLPSQFLLLVFTGAGLPLTPPLTGISSAPAQAQVLFLSLYFFTVRSRLVELLVVSSFAGRITGTRLVLFITGVGSPLVRVALKTIRTEQWDDPPLRLDDQLVVRPGNHEPEVRLRLEAQARVKMSGWDHRLLHIGELVEAYSVLFCVPTPIRLPISVFLEISSPTVTCALLISSPCSFSSLIT